MKKIMFNDQFGLTQAVLEGRKTQTRRIVSCKLINEFGLNKFNDKSFEIIQHANYKIGEEVAVAQKYKEIWDTQKRDFRVEIGMESDYEEGFIYTKFIEHGGWNNKMFVCADHMPYQIRITDIRVERLKEISDEDCLKEGIRPYNGSMIPQGTIHYVGSSIDIIPPYGFDDYKSKLFRNYYTPKEAYSELIGRIEGKGTWKRNPWVFVYEFELLKGGQQ